MIKPRAKIRENAMNAADVSSDGVMMAGGSPLRRFGRSVWRLKADIAARPYAPTPCGALVFQPIRAFYVNSRMAGMKRCP